MQQKFFAFGSFSKGQFHHSKISPFITGEKQGFVKGSIYRLRCGFPALIPGDGGLVEGVLYDLEVPETYFAILDALMGFDPQKTEKCLFNRVEVPVSVDNYTKVSAFSYCLNPKKKVTSHKKITGGDWVRDIQAHPPITSFLQDRQRQYISRLAQSKGRDIVPIKLDLYRELMNLELIVDKGRRLALTPMGREAAFFMES